MNKNPFYEVAAEIIKDRKKYVRASIRFLKKDSIFEPEDVFQETFASFWHPEKGRKWQQGKCAKTQFMLAMISAAKSFKKADTRNETKVQSASEKKNVNVFYVPKIQQSIEIRETIKIYFNLLIKHNKVDLFFVLKGLVEDQTDKEISESLNLPITKIRYLKRKIRKDIEKL